MIEKIYTDPDIYNIYVPLPNNPLKNLNCYVIKTSEKNLIIDTGFNMPECLEALQHGLEELEIDIGKTEMFLTHMHSDHTGLVTKVMKKDSVIYMSRIDYDYMTNAVNFWNERDIKFKSEGFPEDELHRIISVNPAKVYASESNFRAVKFEDNFRFKIGQYEFNAVVTPGHTPGHACLYMEKEKIMFTGDHVLFDITPNITSWPGVKNSLKDYIESLNKIKKFDILTAFPAHRKNDMDFYERVEQILHHHDDRLQDIIDIISSNPGLDTYTIAGMMKWSMRGKNWFEFPIQQKWFAVGETLSHLDYLIEEKKIYKVLERGIYKYFSLQ
jgi:glyoxylase-like metal-dependent hydrolase (beta-lactamase superfamily II)